MSDATDDPRIDQGYGLVSPAHKSVLYLPEPVPWVAFGYVNRARERHIIRRVEPVVCYL